MYHIKNNNAIEVSFFKFQRNWKPYTFCIGIYFPRSMLFIYFCLKKSFNNIGWSTIVMNIISNENVK